MKRSHKERIYILGLFLITVLFFINGIDQTVKAVIIIAIFICVVILKFFVKDTDSSKNE